KFSNVSFEGILIHDNGIAIDINEALVKMFGYSREEVIGKNIIELIVPHEYHARIRENIAKSNPVPYSVMAKKKDGTLFHIEIESKSIEDARGSYRVTALRDISRRKQAEQSFQESEQKYRTLLDKQKIAVFLHKLRAEGFSPFSEVNAYAIEHYGYSREEFMALSPTDISIKDAVSKYGGVDFRKELLTRESLEFETMHIKKSGEQFPVEINTSIIDLQGEKYILSTVRDITEKKHAEDQRQELEAQLRQKYKMEAVGVMAGGIAHDFNNILAIILGNIELSLLKLPPQNEIVPRLGAARTAILRARDLVQQILTYSRQDVQGFKPLELPSIVDETLKLLRSTIPATIEIKTAISQSNATINADATQIQEVLINLCNNAVHAMNGRGTLQISLESVQLDPADIPVASDISPGWFVRLSVQDSGSGMEPEVLRRIFDPFFTTKNVGEGTGMGLAVVHGIIESHGGFSHVSSFPGHGTTFELYFPSTDQPTPEEISAIQTIPKGHEQILFVDDEEMLAEIGSRMLSEHGYNVATSTNSQKALELFKENPDQFDLVITDQTMPDLSGKDLLKELLDTRPNLATILCTGYSTQINEGDIEELGIKAFCMKPLDLPELLETVRRVLDEK
ncbi:MAG: PAS domain S-box protein, partial [Thermodesulfobacteriota bacterium]|nr:PAS domain S-box protein [Thermodesulfobacteriota bacterium]